MEAMSTTFASTADGPDDLYRIPVIGGDPQRILSNVSGAIGFSNDGRRIAFIRSASEPRSTTLQVADADGRNEWSLASRLPPKVFVLTAPSWSPGDTSIACAVWDTNLGSSSTVVAIDVARHTERELTPFRWFFAKDVQWLRDGGGLVVIALREKLGPHQLWRVAASDGAVTSITSDLNSYSGLDLASDGASLVTVETRVVSSVFVSSSRDGIGATKITPGAGRYFGVAWTPDERLVYSAAAGTSANLWSCDGDGRNPRTLTADGFVNRDPTVSSDGRYVYYSSNRNGTFNIWRIDSDGGNPKQITAGDDDSFPCCSATGQWVVYQGLTQGVLAIWRVGGDGGQSERLTQTSAYWPSVSRTAAGWPVTSEAHPRTACRRQSSR